jgi:hypothetical protein
VKYWAFESHYVLQVFFKIIIKIVPFILKTYFTLWSIFLPEKLSSSQIVRNSSNFTDSETSLPRLSLLVFSIRGWVNSRAGIETLDLPGTSNNCTNTYPIFNNDNYKSFRHHLNIAVTFWLDYWLCQALNFLLNWNCNNHLPLL